MTQMVDIIKLIRFTLINKGDIKMKDLFIGLSLAIMYLALYSYTLALL